MAERKNVNNGDWDAKGDLLAGTANDAFDQVAVGADGTVLTADSAQTTGVTWASPAAPSGTLLVSDFDAKGELLAGTANDAFDQVTVGANGTVLTADSGQTTGMIWAAPAAPAGVVLVSDFDAKGDILVGTANDAFDQLAVGANNKALVAASGETTGAKWDTLNPFYGLPYKSAHYYSGDAIGLFVSGTPTLNRVYAFPIYIRRTTTFDRIAMNSTTNGSAGSVVRLGIFNDDGAGYPGTVLLDAGTVSVSAGAPVLKEITISQSLSVGLYWLAAVNQVAAGGTMQKTNIGAGSAPAAPPWMGRAIGTGGPVPAAASYRDSQAGALATFTTTAERNEDLIFVWLRAS